MTHFNWPPLQDKIADFRTLELASGRWLNNLLGDKSIAAHMMDSVMDRALSIQLHRLLDFKLAIARHKGRTGWWDASRCSIDYLRELLQLHLDRDDMLDVCILAAMIYMRQLMDKAATKKE